MERPSDKPPLESALATALALTDQVLTRRTLEERSAFLEAALRRAAESERRQTEFLATLAHELRNQLGPAMNSLELMKQPHFNAVLLERARAMMERQVLQMTRLVDDLLDVSRIAFDRVGIRKTQVDLAVVLEHAVEASGPALEATGHTLTLTSPPGPVLLEADSMRLTQVFDNLLTNAGKYTDPGGRIAVTLELQGSDALVRVADNGIGIPPSLLTRVFEKFVQVDPSLERTAGGLGIGLALARQLVELHGGTITAHSEGVGRGSEFIVRLPILTDQLMLRDPTPVSAQPMLASTYRILLVDDNRDALESLALLLTLQGYQTKTAPDGFAALEQAASYLPRVILLDIGLPRMGGYEVCRAIRAAPWGKDMVVIALTGRGQEEDRRQRAAAGFTGHLVKPVDYACLLEVLARVGEAARHSTETEATVRSFEQ